MNQFQAGKAYQCRSICDHDCIWTITITSRTQKSVTFTVSGEAGTKRAMVKVDEDGEWFYPLGRYSMAPVVKA